MGVVLRAVLHSVRSGHRRDLGRPAAIRRGTAPAGQGARAACRDAPRRGRRLAGRLSNARRQPGRPGPDAGVLLDLRDCHHLLLDDRLRRMAVHGDDRRIRSRPDSRRGPACYAVGFAIYWTFCDFTFLEGAPVYVPSADPQGLFPGVERGRLLHVGADDPFRVALLRPLAAHEQAGRHEAADARRRAGRRVAARRVRALLGRRLRDAAFRTSSSCCACRSRSSSAPSSS